MGKSVTLGWLCPRTVTLVTEPPFCDMSYMSLPIVTFGRSEEHTSELQSLMRISYAVFCLKKKKTTYQDIRKVSTRQKSKYITTAPHINTYRNTQRKFNNYQ